MTTICIISDGKAGHLNQSLGLCDALKRHNPDMTITTVPAFSRFVALRSGLTGRWPVAVEQTPDVVIGTGHSTHLTLLAARRAFNAYTVVLMKPSLPLRWFDLCLIPQHDQVKPTENVIATQGALNRMRPATQPAATDQGMLLIGGPSKHHGWDSPAMVAQVLHICHQQPHCRWTLTTSRRTPSDFIQLLREQQRDNLTIIPVEETQPGWLAAQLPHASQCWVSEDSVSMVYEALTAGCATGLLEVPQSSQSRIGAGLQMLLDQQQVTAYRQWQPGATLAPPATPVSEAQRCADELLNRLPA